MVITVSCLCLRLCLCPVPVCACLCVCVWGCACGCGCGCGCVTTSCHPMNTEWVQIICWGISFMYSLYIVTKIQSLFTYLPMYIWWISGRIICRIPVVLRGYDECESGFTPRQLQGPVQELFMLQTHNKDMSRWEKIASKQWHIHHRGEAMYISVIDFHIYGIQRHGFQ